MLFIYILYTFIFYDSEPHMFNEPRQVVELRRDNATLDIFIVGLT